MIPPQDPQQESLVDEQETDDVDKFNTPSINKIYESLKSPNMIDPFAIERSAKLQEVEEGPSSKEINANTLPLVYHLFSNMKQRYSKY